MFWFHSWYNPISKIKIKKNLIFVQKIKFTNLNSGIMGKIRAISTSKIKKITVIKKKCNENGIRADDFGSNPHSKGEHFSRSENVFFERIIDSNIIMLEINIIIKKIFVIRIIIYIKIIKLFDWKSNILNILYK